MIKGQTGRGTGPRPHTWITGPDELTHAQYRAFIQCRAQANYRGEGWELEFDQYQAAWGYNWGQRGRASEHMCMTRTDHQLPWSEDNVQIITREQHANNQGFRRRGWRKNQPRESKV